MVAAVEIFFVFVGKNREAYLEAGVEDYLGRVRRYLKAEVRLVPAEPRRRNADEKKALAREAQRLKAALAAADYVVCLDVSGKQLSSESLARKLEELMLGGVRRLAFVVGGAGGLSAELLGAAHLRLSLSPMTFTHEMCRVIILEQVYRALTIRAGQPYHH
jgi:23S rRNA (pseudouridine1915-N3)-methyltransferase